MVANFSNMKRRNADYGRPRRPLKRTKIAEGFYSSTFLYLKFLGIWATVLLFDFLLEFRFEYLWPVWLLLRSIYDSYKYQGLAFSIFFVFIAFTSDMICLLFIPVHWLFFVASTYVWVQLVWHTDRGVCLPTASLWLLFVYIEASVRLRELRTALPFHLDLCRPFAAHCIGYPVVTLGFGFKSYVGYRLRLRKQREVQKENEFYMQLLQQALPQESPPSSSTSEKGKALTHKGEEPISNGSAKKSSPNGHVHHRSSSDGNNPKENKHCRNNGANNVTSNNKTDPNLLDAKLTQRIVNYHESTRENMANEQAQQAKQLRHNTSGGSSSKSSKHASSSSLPNGGPSGNRGRGGGNRSLPSKVENKEPNASSSAATTTPTAAATTTPTEVIQNGLPATSPPFNKDEFVISRLESDVKKLKADLQGSRQTESDLRSEISKLVSDEKKAKADWEQLQKENESLQTRLHNLVTQKQQDKQNIGKLEQKVKQERDTRSLAESQLREERKNRKMEEAAARAMILAAANPSRIIECTETCRTKQKDQEKEIGRLVKEGRDKQEKLWDLERKVGHLQERQETQNHNERLMSNLMVLQEKTTKLETSLSAETRLKMDLFSALGDARRQLEIAEGLLRKKDQEIQDLKSKIADIMSVMPHSAYQTSPPPISGLPPSLPNLPQGMGVQRFFCMPPPPPAAVDVPPIPAPQVPPTTPPTDSMSPPKAPKQPHQQLMPMQMAPLDPRAMSPGSLAQMQNCGSGLDPNAAIYRPKSN